ncbi:MAG: hypothetical protein JW781_06640 [Deltaproteobacteria bacterium]|nr:hypothetical protein [Candidatus Anaeroferrophillacea bacterium]
MVPLDSEPPVRVILSHENITPLLLAKEELHYRTVQLEERNTALKVLLEQRQRDRGELEESLVRNLHREVMPLIDMIRGRVSEGGEEAELVALLRRRLEDILDPLLPRLELAGVILTAREAHIAGLVCDGRTTKEIAGLLRLSPETVQFHRKNIRRKLGLTNRAGSLRDFLLRQAKR